MQNEMPMTSNRSKSKQEVEFQYGSLSFSETGNSYTQLWIEIPLRNLVHLRYWPSEDMRITKLEPEVSSRRHGRHLENFNDVITTPPMVRFAWNLVCRC